MTEPVYQAPDPISQARTSDLRAAVVEALRDIRARHEDDCQCGICQALRSQPIGEVSDWLIPQEEYPPVRVVIDQRPSRLVSASFRLIPNDGRPIQIANEAPWRDELRIWIWGLMETSGLILATDPAELPIDENSGIVTSVTGGAFPVMYFQAPVTGISITLPTAAPLWGVVPSMLFGGVAITIAEIGDDGSRRT